MLWPFHYKENQHILPNFMNFRILLKKLSKLCFESIAFQIRNPKPFLCIT